MGLDITAYETVEATDLRFPVKENGVPEGWPEDETEQLIMAFAYAGFERSLDGLEAGRCYRSTGRTMHFRAGSYGGYGQWRDDLALTTWGRSGSDIWASRDQFESEPFFELICFADNEGTIGPAAAARLAADFHDHAEDYRAKHANTDNDWFVGKYQEWTEAFDLAAHTGLVEFH